MTNKSDFHILLLINYRTKSATAQFNSTVFKLYVTGFVKRGLIRAIINMILKYSIHYISRMDRAACMQFATDLQLFKVIQYPLFNG